MRTYTDELNGDLRKIAEVAGMEAAVKIWRAFRGTCLYINGLEQLKRKLRDEEIRHAYDGGANVRALCLRFGLTERHVRRIIGEPAAEDLSPTLLDLIKD